MGAIEVRCPDCGKGMRSKDSYDLARDPGPRNTLVPFICKNDVCGRLAWVDTVTKRVVR